MKQCPVCKTTYTDDTLQFCLADGAALTFLTTEQPTEQFSVGTSPIRVNITRDETPTVVAQKFSPPPESVRKGGSGLIIGLLVVLLGLVVLGSAGIIGWLLLRDDKPVAETNKTTTTLPNLTTQTPQSNLTTQTPTPNPDTENLKEKIANLERKLEEQKKNQTVPTINNPTTTTTPPPQKKQVVARVNSPGDGFLALRTQPSAEVGDRILKIPHGANVTVYACLPKAAGKKGRWCRVDYNGNAGWAYDGFLIY